MANHRPSNATTHRESVSSSTSRTYYNKTFEDTTDLFLFACAHGDYVLVHRLLCEGEVQADVSNKMGKSALQLAIENEHFEVVKVLLDKIPYEKFRDALLLAIYLGHTNIADFIMNHPTYRTFCGGFLDPTHPQAYDDSQFSSDITPLILAAQYNRLQIVHQLLSKGERIKKPHASMCPCVDCADSSAYDSFRQAQVRLSAYKGLSSEVYIALTYPDPILQAFDLSRELRMLAKVEHYFREDYQKLANQLSLFVTRLLDNVRGHEELEIVLNKTGRPNEEKYENLARFDLAIQYQEKAFVSHSNCQQKLMEKWYENLSAIKNAHLTKRLLFYLAFIICLPLLLLAYYLIPKSRIGSLCHQPNLKLKAYIVSYLTFIGLIVASSYFSISHLQKTKFLSNYDNSTYEKYIKLIYNNTALRERINVLHDSGKSYNENQSSDFINCDISLRFTEPNPFQIAIFIWVIGFVWQEFKQIFSSGVRVYLTSHSNYVDCAMNILYILHFIFLYTSMIYTRTALNTMELSSYWTDVRKYNTLGEYQKDMLEEKTYHALYWLNADRYYWTSADAQNLAEAFFALGNVFSICRICFLLPIIGFVGPLQVMLERMIIDILKWIVIIIIFFLAFACSLYLIFAHFAISLEYQTNVQSNETQFLETNTNISSSSEGYFARCPEVFFSIMGDQHEQAHENWYRPTTSDPLIEKNTLDQCPSNVDDKNLIQMIGSRPAIYYFGRSFISTILTTFFTLFGAGVNDNLPDRGYELMSLTCYKPDPKSYTPGFDMFVSNLGFIIFGLFTFICVTVLINTLIAMMEGTIDTIDDRADVEWKFARSRLYMEYVRDGNTLPVPLNICPTPKSFIYLMKRIKNCLCKKDLSADHPEAANGGQREERLDGLNIRTKNLMTQSTQHDKFKNERIFARQRSYVHHEKLTYKIVIERIVKRFLLYYKNKHMANDENNDGLEFKEFKNDVSSLRFELLNEIDILDEMKMTTVQLMKKLQVDLDKHFNIEQIKFYLSNQKNSTN